MCGERECSCTVYGYVNWYHHYGRFLKKLGIKPPYDPTISLLGVYPEETKIEKDMCIPLFIAALFTIARTWKPPRCSSTDEWIKRCGTYIHYGILLSHKKNTFELVLMRRINLEPILQHEVSQKEKNKYLILMHIYIWNLEKWYWRVYLQGSNRETSLKNRVMDMGRGRRAWDVGEK